MSSKSIYYVYMWLREDQTPYYIGKGKGGRAYRKGCPKDRVRIVAHNLFEHEAFLLERKLIKYFGRKDLGTGILRNLTDGGEGITGKTHSEETREKMRAAHLGKKLSQETREKLRVANLGKKLSQETREKMRAAHVGMTHVGMTGKTHSEETREKMRAGHVGMTGKTHSEETREKMRAAHVGNTNRKLKDYTINKIRECYLAGMNTSEICRHLKVSYPSVRKYTKDIS